MYLSLFILLPFYTSILVKSFAFTVVLLFMSGVFLVALARLRGAGFFGERA